MRVNVGVVENWVGRAFRAMPRSTRIIAPNRSPLHVHVHAATEPPTPASAAPSRALHRRPTMSSSSSPPLPSPTPTIRPPEVVLDDSDSDASQATLQQQRSPPPPQPPAQNYSRPAPIRDATQSQSHTGGLHLGHRPRQRSQGYFEPSLSSARDGILAAHEPLSLSPSPAAAAAQAAYAQNAQHNRKRSTTIPAPTDTPQGRTQPMSPPPLPVPQTVTFRTNGMTYQNSAMGSRMGATSAASAAFSRSPLTSPGMDGQQSGHPSPKPASTPEPQLPKAKEGKSKMKLFSSKPKAVRSESRTDTRTQPLPSPGKIGIGIHSTQALNRMMMNQSTTSLAETGTSSSSASLYSSANASTSTLVPPRSDSFLPPEKKEEKHKHHFLSRQKHKLKDKDEHALPLSSVNSTSRPTDPSAQPLYSFAAPSSPGHAGSFTASVTGLDLRHGGRNLRRAKKEEKAAAYLDAQLDPPYRERNHSFSTERTEWASIASSITTTPSLATPAQTISHTTEMLQLGSSFGIHGLAPDDAWPLLKARVLLIFEGEDPRPPVEDFNALVTVHIKRCIGKRSPILLIEDLNELLQTGFGSLDQTLRHVPDDRLIPHLVEMWLVVFTTILPFLQAVFLPLDLEFRGSGIMTSAQAAEFWGVMLPDEMNTKSPEHKNIPILGELEVRRITLLMFRDIVILPRYEALMAIFSRLSLENLNAGLDSPSPIPHDIRPGTASSANELHMGSLNSTSQSSGGYLESTTSITSSTFASTRSRATSNTSAGSFSSNPSQHAPINHVSTINHLHPPPNTMPSSLRQQPMDSAKVTETVGRMLQCVSVLVSLQSSDEAQEKIGRLNKELKYNWLGRGRTGRQRQGFVGPRSRGVGGGGGVGAGSGGGMLNLAAGGITVSGIA